MAGHSAKPKRSSASKRPKAGAGKPRPAKPKTGRVQRGGIRR